MRKIVLIEDDSDLVALLRYNLQKEGFQCVDAQTGKDLWHFPGNSVSYANPISYLSHGKQQVAIAIGDVLMAFGLD